MYTVMVPINMHKETCPMVPINCILLRLEIWVPIVYNIATRSNKTDLKQAPITPKRLFKFIINIPVSEPWERNNSQEDY